MLKRKDAQLARSAVKLPTLRLVEGRSVLLSADGEREGSPEESALPPRHISKRIRKHEKSREKRATNERVSSLGRVKTTKFDEA